MKLLFILSAVFLTTAQANFFTDLGQGFTNLFKALGQSILHQLDTTGVQLLNASVAAGKTLISQGIQALALNTANALAKSSRDIQLPAMLKNVESSLNNVLDTVMGEMKNVFGFLVKGLQGVVDKITKLDITPEEVFGEVDKFVNTHNLIADSFLKTTKDKVEEVIFSLIKSKRNNFTDFFAGTGDSLTKTVKPMVDGVKTLATAAGAIIKGGATILLLKAKDSVTQLGQTFRRTVSCSGGCAFFPIYVEPCDPQPFGVNTANALAKHSRDIQLPAMLKNVESSLHNVVDTLMGEMKNVFSFLVKGLQGVVDKMTKVEITREEVIKEVDKLVNTHNLIADSFLKTTKDKAEEVIFSLIKSKRNNFTDFFAGTGESLTKTFKPMVDGVKTLATAAGAIIQSGATILLLKAKDSVTQLGQTFRRTVVCPAECNYAVIHPPCLTLQQILKDAGLP